MPAVRPIAEAALAAADARLSRRVRAAEAECRRRIREAKADHAAEVTPFFELYGPQLAVAPEAEALTIAEIAALRAATKASSSRRAIKAAIGRAAKRDPMAAEARVTKNDKPAWRRDWLARQRVV